MGNKKGHLAQQVFGVSVCFQIASEQMRAAPKASSASTAASVPGSVVHVRIFRPEPRVPLGNPVLPVICLGHLFSLVLRNSQKKNCWPRYQNRPYCLHLSTGLNMHSCYCLSKASTDCHIRKEKKIFFFFFKRQVKKAKKGVHVAQATFSSAQKSFQYRQHLR